MGTFHKVAETKNLAAGQGMAVEVAGNKIALFNVDGTCYAIADTCSHRGGPLSEGALEGTTVTCPWHVYGAEPGDVFWAASDVGWVVVVPERGQASRGQGKLDDQIPHGAIGNLASVIIDDTNVVAGNGLGW